MELSELWALQSAQLFPTTTTTTKQEPCLEIIQGVTKGASDNGTETERE